jgi:DNA-binding XRE family transcriptional regulator
MSDRQTRQTSPIAKAALKRLGFVGLNGLTVRGLTGAQLRGWRDSQGMTQQQLAGEIGVHWTTVSRWERGSGLVPGWVALALVDLTTTQEPTGSDTAARGGRSEATS